MGRGLCGSRVRDLLGHMDHWSQKMTIVISETKKEKKRFWLHDASKLRRKLGEFRRPVR